MRGAGLLFYRRLASPLHAARAGVGALWAAALTAAALILYNPLPLGALAIAVLGAAAGAGVGRQLVRTLRIAVIVGLPIVVINVLASRQGLTVFARLGNLGPFGQGNLTVEAVVYGAVIALKLTLLMLITTLASLAVDPDELLRGFRRLSFRSALTASLATRMIPVLGADAQRLAEAQRTRPEDPSRGVRGRVALLSAIVGGSLERAIEVAATLELRGFAVAAESRARSRRSRWRRSQTRLRRPWSRHDLAFGCSAFAVIALALVGRLSGAASFAAYPLLRMQTGGGTWVLCAALIAAVLLPFADRRGTGR
ncbi:MAG TPA: energy-coupling factor transporter transmembrane protein EcfT [Solirubrobacteraceae bacterium]|jgi:energy-coupling factor transport system permease protein|nr:energy-coupling factor transporter transmembrane protein EcfT [Solirubrobacteraceae bacterium]